MSQEEIQFITQFQVTVLNPIQSNLMNRKHRNWEHEPFSMDIEEILCSISVLPLTNGKSNSTYTGEFDLAYTCKGDIIEASYRLGDPVERVEHCLWELKQYLELYALQHGLLPINSEVDHLNNGIHKLLQIVNPERYGKFSI